MDAMIGNSPISRRTMVALIMTRSTVASQSRESESAEKRAATSQLELIADDIVNREILAAYRGGQSNSIAWWNQQLPLELLLATNTFLPNGTAEPAVVQSALAKLKFTVLKLDSMLKIDRFFEQELPIVASEIMSEDKTGLSDSQVGAEIRRNQSISAEIGRNLALLSTSLRESSDFQALLVARTRVRIAVIATLRGLPKVTKELGERKALFNSITLLESRTRLRRIVSNSAK